MRLCYGIVWADILLAPQRLGHTPLQLLHALVALVVLAVRPWRVPLLPSPLGRWPGTMFSLMGRPGV